jgi:hypothetical protein
VHIDVLETGPMLRLGAKTDAARPAAAVIDTIVVALRDASPHLRIYRGDTLPAGYHTDAGFRLPPVVGLADDGWLVLTRRERDRWLARGGGVHGDHGFRPESTAMHGLFIASGPAFLPRHVPPFESVHLYSLFCRLLGIVPAPHDGDPAVTAGLLRSVGA